jgi:ribonuclease D
VEGPRKPDLAFPLAVLVLYPSGLRGRTASMLKRSAFDRLPSEGSGKFLSGTRVRSAHSKASPSRLFLQNDKLYSVALYPLKAPDSLTTFEKANRSLSKTNAFRGFVRLTFLSLDRVLDI